MFKSSTFSNKLDCSKTALDLENSAKRYGFDQLADELGLKHSRVSDEVAGIATGAYRKLFEYLIITYEQNPSKKLTQQKS